MEEESDDESSKPTKQKPAFSMKLNTKPNKTIRRKQLKAKSKAISDQIKKRKQFKKKKPNKS